MNDINTPMFEYEQKNSFKITKNSKGKNYEFKVVEENLEELKKKVLEIDRWAEEMFGVNSEGDEE